MAPTPGTPGAPPSAVLPDGAAGPDRAWLERVFGADGLWRPADAELPDGLTHRPTRSFLTTVGLPAVRIGRLGLDARFLREDGLWVQQADELYGGSRPRGDGAPSDGCVKLMEHPDFHFVLDGESGAVDLFLPDAWDRGEGFGGHYARSVPRLVADLGLAATAVAGVDDVETDLEPALETFLGHLRHLDRLDRPGPPPDRPELWADVFEYVDEYHE
ncbi:SUKH-4 family immunity protein [Kitasatospora sp. NPDC096147]|uniref:SUKH-4 family immunity protein n=1 Tax=Kitasatospora sp. NPDC096147 TaxID=3364093 RepID=UPI003830C124